MSPDFAVFRISHPAASKHLMQQLHCVDIIIEDSN